MLLLGLFHHPSADSKQDVCLPVIIVFKTLFDISLFDFGRVFVVLQPCANIFCQLCS
jgi:hypothetical protein